MRQKEKEKNMPYEIIVDELISSNRSVLSGHEIYL